MTDFAGHGTTGDACTFCSIVSGRAKAWRVYEDEISVAFLDIGQATVGHTLVVPRLHATDIWALTEDDAAAVMRSVHRVARLLRERLDAIQINLSQSNGRAAWQEVFHYHVHVVLGLELTRWLHLGARRRRPKKS